MPGQVHRACRQRANLLKHNIISSNILEHPHFRFDADVVVRHGIQGACEVQILR